MEKSIKQLGKGNQEMRLGISPNWRGTVCPVTDRYTDPAVFQQVDQGQKWKAEDGKREVKTTGHFNSEEVSIMESPSQRG